MILKILGDGIEGEKIVLEAGFVKLNRGIVRAQGHHGDKAIGTIRAVAFITKSYSSVSPKPVKFV